MDIALENQQTVIVALYIDPYEYELEDLETRDPFYPIATEAAVLDVRGPAYTGTDSHMALLEGKRRVRILKITKRRPILTVQAQIIPDENVSDDVFREFRPRLLDYMLRRWKHLPDMDNWQFDVLYHATDATQLANRITAYLDFPLEKRVAYLESPDVSNRLNALSISLEGIVTQLEDEHQQNLAGLAERAARLAALEKQVGGQLNGSENGSAPRASTLPQTSQTPQTYEQSVQQELDMMRQRIDATALPDDVRSKAMREFTRLSALSPLTQEASILRTYLDWLLSLPWQHSTEDNLELEAVQRVLDEEHYGLKKAKERILEHIAVRKLAGDKMRSPILCFVGPPGVGKTSLGRSIAHALGREFVRISLGGVHDEAEIRGHRRTYVSALPGRIIQAMQRAGTVNPVLLLDEIDKIWADSQGDPRAALLEVLDPEQNKAFSDHFLEVPYDLSQVMFIATANDLYPLPEALEDRMEIIEFHAYTEEEKLDIAQQFLIPRQLESHGIAESGIKFQTDALTTIIRKYTMEAGVRNLDREIARVCRKIAVRVASDQKSPRRITSSIVERYLGPPPVLPTHINRDDRIGIVTSLTWTNDGGDVQAIEVTLTPGKGNLTLTGQLGEVLQESAQAALTYMRTRAKDFDVHHDDFENYDVHVHLPEGGVPKDGPSAGITIAAAMISVFTERPIRSDTAMTGEVTLRGYVLPVGGIKDKVLAARRNGIKQVIMPKENEKDLTEIPKEALRDLQIHLAETMQDVIDLALLDAPAQRQRDLDNASEDDNSADQDTD